jgi:histone H3/H4
MAKTRIIKTTTVKTYITKSKKMRSQAAAIKKFIDDFDNVIEAVIVEAVRLAKEAKRNTIMKVDMVAAIDKYLKKTDLTWDQTAAEVIKHNPTDLGKISKTILEWINAHEAGTKRKHKMIR